MMEYISEDDIKNELFRIKRNRHSKLEDYSFLSTISPTLLTWSIYKKALDQQPMSLQYFVDQPEDICSYAVQQNGMVLSKVREQTENICLKAVKNQGLSLMYVKKQTTVLCLEAVKQNGLALFSVSKKTYKLCIEAVKQIGSSLQYVPEEYQTEELIKMALADSGENLQYVKKKTPEICLEALLLANEKNYEFIIDHTIFIEKKCLTYNDYVEELNNIIKKNKIIMAQL